MMIFTKTKKVMAPQQKLGDAGIDFFIPDEHETMKLAPGDSVIIPSGIKVVVPIEHVLIAFNKSGVATKKNLQVGACVVDSGYRGEVHIHLTNVGHATQTITGGDKIVQFVLLPYEHGYLSEVGQNAYAEFSNTERGEGRFGSTDQNPKDL